MEKKTMFRHAVGGVFLNDPNWEVGEMKFGRLPQSTNFPLKPMNMNRLQARRKL